MVGFGYSFEQYNWQSTKIGLLLQKKIDGRLISSATRNAPLHGLGPRSIVLVNEACFMRDRIGILNNHTRTSTGGSLDPLKGPDKVLGLVLVLDHAAVAHQRVRWQLALRKSQERFGHGAAEL